MGLGRLNPGCNDCGCVPVLNCPPCPDCRCHADDSCEPLSIKTITITLQLGSYDLSGEYEIEYYYDPVEVTFQCGTSGTFLFTNPAIGAGTGGIPAFWQFAYSFTDTAFYVLPTESSIFFPGHTPAYFEYEPTCFCSTWESQEFTQTQFPNEPWAAFYPWLDPNGWLMIAGYFIVLKSVVRGTLTI